MDRWLVNLWSFLRRFLSKSITPIFVFDGVHPEDKSDTQIKRREERNKTHAQVLELKDQISKINTLEVDPTMVEKLRTLMRRDTFIAGDESDVFQEILQSIGIPVLQAPGEAEKHCAMLVLEGLASAVFSTDTDTLVYGCPLLITGFTASRLDMMEVTILERALKGLNFTFDQFQELCFLLGCDYNNRIRGIGPVKAVKHMRDYGSIANFPAKLDKSVLKLDVVRKLFSRVPSGISEEEVTLRRDSLETARTMLDAFRIGGWMEPLTQYYSVWKPVSAPVILPGTDSPTATNPKVINKSFLSKNITRAPADPNDLDE